MLPVLFDLKNIKIYTFGVFLVLAFFWGCFTLWKNVRLTAHKEEEIFDGLFVSMFGGIFVGRLIYVSLNFKDFGIDILKFILINGYPGLSLYGMLLGFFGSLYFFFNSKKIKFSQMADYFISPIFLALAFAKLGSFFSGTEVGTKSKIFLSVKYTGYDGFRHLTAFYEAIIFFIGAYIAQKLIFEIRKEKYQQGLVLYFFIWVFSLTTLLFDQIKEQHLAVYGQSFNRLASIFLLLTFSLYFIYYFKSFISKRFAGIINYFTKHGKKIIKTVHRHPKKEVGS